MIGLVIKFALIQIYLWYEKNFHFQRETLKKNIYPGILIKIHAIVLHCNQIMLETLFHTCGTSIMAKVVPAIEKPTACPRFLSKNVFNATNDDAIASPVPKPIIKE